jgi:D-alanine-D-alanine ligase
MVQVLCGGASAEREVSLRSGAAVAAALARRHPCQLRQLEQNRLPADLDPARDVVLPMLHGTYGEDGELQRELELAGFVYAGCDAAASALCMDKPRCKEVVAAVGVPVLAQQVFSAAAPPAGGQLVAALGPRLVIKPVAQGSSVGLFQVADAAAAAAVLARLEPGQWMAEPWLRGVDLTIGVLAGRALAVVEIRPRSGVYDYQHKYTAGLTTYLVPAPRPPELLRRLAALTEAAFAACACRDFARVDWFLDEAGEPWFLEINTIPGMTETSLLPKSAGPGGLAYADLVGAMVEPAIERWRARRSIPIS